MLTHVAACLIHVLSAAYDPLDRPASGPAAPLELQVADPESGRTVPLRVHLPARPGPAPTVLFSHGLGGTNHGVTYLADHWSARGFAVVCLQHPGSDEGVWRDEKLGRRMAAMKQAASGRNLMLRVRDVQRTLDALERWTATPGHPLQGRIDMAAIGMSGHSFGALTTQAVSGQSVPLLGARFTDPRIRAALPMSPSSPRAGDPGRAFGSVTIPWMLFTGTEDTAPIGNTDVASRLAVYPALPAGIPRYELVLGGAPHSAFTDRLRQSTPESERYHRTVLALSTAFWDAHLRRAADARAWLEGAGPRAVLDASDRWQWAAPR